MASPPIIEDSSQASRRAKIRIAVAIALLVTAVGILAVLNQHNPPVEKHPVTALPPQESISSQETEKPVDQEAPQITGMSSPAQESTAEPSPATVPPPPTPGKLPAAPIAKPQQQAAASAEKTGGHVVSTKPEPATSPAPSKPSTSATPVSEPPKAAAPKEFEVQLGVFGDMENAKQLQTKLAEHGIPSHTETRVQVGPFKTRAEADQAREKLKALGITAVIAPK